MANHLNDEDLNRVTGGIVSYANASGEQKSPKERTAYPVIQAKCADCGETFLGPSNQVDRNVKVHLSTSGHSYCCYTDIDRPH